MRGIAVRVLIVLGAILAGLGIVAGHVNRQVVDGSAFAGHVDEIRRDPAVAAEIGASLTDQIVQAKPDLVAVRPLVADVAERVAGSDALSGPTRLAAETAHQALTDPGGGSVVLRLADLGAVVTGAVGVIAPDRAGSAGEVSVTLATLNDQPVAQAAAAAARATGLLSWLLPVLALICFAIAITLSRARWATAAAAGKSLIWAAGVLGAILLIGGFVVRRLDDTELTGAIARAGWSEMLRPMWWPVAILAVIGITVRLCCDTSAPATLSQWAERAGKAVTRRPTNPAGVVIRALIAGVVGVIAIIDPLAMVEPLIVLGGVVLVIVMLVEIARLAPATRAAAHDDDAEGGWSWRRAVIIGAIAALVAVIGIVLQARPGGEVPAVASTNSGKCNGHAELCDRRFNDVAYATSHNAMSVAGEPGWFLGEQRDPIPVQLDQGVRALLVDVWSGQSAGSVVRTAASSYREALAVAETELGPEVVAAALRVASSVAGKVQGPEARHLCHGLCETGSTPFLDMLAGLRTWLAKNPNEVVTLFIEDHVEASLIADDIDTAGLLPYVYEHAVGQPWPTLGEMIESGKRLVVMLEAGDGGDGAPWLINGFTTTQETPYTFPTAESFSCAKNRGAPDAPLLLMNHWLSGFTSLASDARLVNSRDILLPRAEQCQAERGQIPNFVAVNFVAYGDLFDVVDTLNGVN